MRLRHNRLRHRPLFACFALAAAGCSEPHEVADIPPDVRRIIYARCPPGHVPGADGACMPVGVQGCVELFLEDDNLCHPAAAKCPAGSIPKLDEGCIPVGIPRCAAGLLGEDGLCRPAMARCPQGTFAAPEVGCVPVDGPDGCGDAPWGSIPDDASTVHVDPGYLGANGDGSRARPVTTVAAAMELVADGGTVALADGIYDEPVVVTRPLALVGRCPSRVRLRGAGAEGDLPAVLQSRNQRLAL